MVRPETNATASSPSRSTINIHTSHSNSPTRHSLRRKSALPSRYTSQGNQLTDLAGLQSEVTSQGEQLAPETMPRWPAKHARKESLQKPVEGPPIEPKSLESRPSRPRNRGGRPHKIDLVAEKRAQDEAQLSYLDKLYSLGVEAKRREINLANAQTSRLYRPRYRPIPEERERVARKGGGYEEPQPWERARYKQDWEKTPAAREFSKYVTPTEADDFSTSDEDEPDVPSTHGTNPRPDSAISAAPASFFLAGPTPASCRVHIFELSLPLSQQIFGHVFADCVKKYDKPDWYERAKTIFRLTPQEEDWLTDKYLQSVGKPSLQETWGGDEDPWHFDAARNQRAELRHKLRYDPGTALKWLDESVRGYIEQEDVEEASRYLRERGFSSEIIDRMELAGFLDDVAGEGAVGEEIDEDIDVQMTDDAQTSIETD